MEEKLEANAMQCKSCGGNLIFSPADKGLKCEKCQNVYEINSSNQIAKHDAKSQQDQTDEYKEYAKQNKLFKCSNCGGSVVVNMYEISKTCPYCGTSLVASTSALPGIKPDGCIPFAFDEKQASENFAKNVKKKWLAPKQFKKALPPSKIKGIYIPSFCFDGKTQSTYRGVLYNDVTTTDSDGNSYTDRQYFNISGSYNYNFENLIVESSSKMTQDQVSAIEPYNFKGAVNYQDAYIRGYVTEHYSESVNECYKEYHEIAKSELRSMILHKYSYSGVQSFNLSTQFDDEKYSYVLVPVYIFDYSYKQKPYITYMNGQTGRIDSNVPKSKVKVTFLTLLIILIFLLPIIIGIITSINS